MNTALKVVTPSENNLIENLPFDDYLSIDAVSNSLLKKVIQSPAHTKVDIVRTPDMLKGSLIDCAIIEPDLFNQQYIVAPATDKRTTEYKAFIKAHADSSKTIITRDDYALAINCAKSVHSNLDISNMILRSLKQVSMTWLDSDFITLCKGRPDWVSESCMWDLKTTRSCDPGFFKSEIVKRCYHMQAAFYLDGFNACTPNQPPITQFNILALEKTAPFGFRIYSLSPDLIQAGRDLYKNTMDTYIGCLLDDEWLCYDTAPITVECPKWMS